MILEKIGQHFLKNSEFFKNSGQNFQKLSQIFQKLSSKNAKTQKYKIFRYLIKVKTGRKKA